ncbi:MAG: hypothetical protein ACYDED_03185 [Ferrimicrobium sp.]
MDIACATCSQGSRLRVRILSVEMSLLLHFRLMAALAVPSETRSVEASSGRRGRLGVGRTISLDVVSASSAVGALEWLHSR